MPIEFIYLSPNLTSHPPNNHRLISAPRIPRSYCAVRSSIIPGSRLPYNLDSPVGLEPQSQNRSRVTLHPPGTYSNGSAWLTADLTNAMSVYSVPSITTTVTGKDLAFLWATRHVDYLSIESRTSTLSSCGDDGLLSRPYSRVGANLTKEGSDSAMLCGRVGAWFVVCVDGCYPSSTFSWVGFQNGRLILVGEVGEVSVVDGVVQSMSGWDSVAEQAGDARHGGLDDDDGSLFPTSSFEQDT